MVEASHEYVEYVVTRCARAESGTCAELPAAAGGARTLLRAPTALPFLGSHVCYRVVCAGDAGLNNPICINGCLDVKCNTEASSHGAILDRAVIMCLKNKNVNNYVSECLKQRRKDDDGFIKLVKNTFRVPLAERDALVAFVRSSLAAANGWFPREYRSLGAALYCLGFCNRESVVRELTAAENSEESWFLSLGDADCKWKAHKDIDTRYESFGAFLRSFGGRHADFISSVEALIRYDPERFFCATTRPMALRALGGMHKDYFLHYCANMEPPLILDACRLVSVDPECADAEIFVPATEHDHVGATTKILNMTVQTCALNALVALRQMRCIGKLHFVRENDLAAQMARESRILVDCRQHEGGLTGSRSGAICEVHVFCATRRICFVRGGGAVQEGAARAFMCGQAPACMVDVFFRDAHLLTCNVFAHLKWRLSKRVIIDTITMTSRCSDDRSYHGLMWYFLRESAALAPGGAPSRLEAGSLNLGSLKDTDINHLEGVCVVPTAIDATCVADAVVGDYAFSIDPPVFGKIKTLRWSCVLLTQNGPITVPRFRGLRTPNLRKCKCTAKGGYLVPASALFTTSLLIMPELTLLLPDTLSAVWAHDMLTLARSAAERVTCVRVTNYAFPEQGCQRVRQLVSIMHDFS